MRQSFLVLCLSIVGGCTNDHRLGRDDTRVGCGDACAPSDGADASVVDAASFDSASSASDAAVSTCGGFANLPCGNGASCFDDPRDTCTPGPAGIDCTGICLTSNVTTCGMGVQCSTGLTCFDDPRDTCTGSTCPGICL